MRCGDPVGVGHQHPGNNHAASRIDKHVLRYAGDPEQVFGRLSDIVQPMLPGCIVFGQCFFPCRFAGIGRYPDDVEAFAVVGLVGLRQLGDRCAAGPAPAGPEIDECVLGLGHESAYADHVPLGIGHAEIGYPAGYRVGLRDCRCEEQQAAG